MKWIVLLLVVGGLVLASGPVLAQGNQPSQLELLLFKEEAKYFHFIAEYNRLAEEHFDATGGVGPPFPGARRLLAEITAQGRKVAALKQAVAAAQASQSGQHIPPLAQ